MSASHLAVTPAWAPGRLHEPAKRARPLLTPMEAVLRLATELAWGRARRRRATEGGVVGDGHTVTVSDTVRFLPDETSADANAMLRDLVWPAAQFEAVCHVGTRGKAAWDASPGADAVVTFPSPAPHGRGAGERVTLEWYAARDPRGERVDGPAMLSLDILQGENLVSRFLARSFSRNGTHGFAMHMPRGTRGSLPPGRRYDWSAFLDNLRQAVGDARRARDVVAALPGVQGRIGIQGTSLGGFVATLAAAVDNAFDPVIIALAGGDVFNVLSTGRADAERVRLRLRQAGYDDDRLREELWRSEPLRLAHRLDRAKTFLFTARRDQVVPGASTAALVKAARIHPSHHHKFSGCHYTCVVNAPWMIKDMIRVARATS